MSAEHRTLTGDRNQCPGCGQFFNSTLAFDKHRTGAHQGGGRRCLTPVEMAARGMDVNARGYWISASLPTPYLAAIVAKNGLPEACNAY